MEVVNVVTLLENFIIALARFGTLVFLSFSAIRSHDSLSNSAAEGKQVS